MNACFQRRVIAMTEPKKKSYGRAKTGIELTPEVLDRMSAEAEAGLDPTNLRRRPGRPTIGSAPADAFPVRLDPELRRAVDERAKTDHTTSSEVVREALRRYLKVG
jgi:Ribbon-helix-helix protein, copG family